MKFSGFVYPVKDYCCANFHNQQSFLTRLKYNTKIAGITLNQELTYSRHWGKWAAGACQRPDINYKIIQYYNIIKSNLKHSEISNSFQEIHGVGVVV